MPGIVPPPDVRSVIEKTVPVVREGGDQTAHRLLLSKPVLFSFLSPADPFHEWYKGRLEEGRTLVPDKAKKERPIAKFYFSTTQPTISSRDMRVIELTALYTSKDPEFANKIDASRPQFAFLAPTHSPHSFFRSLVEQFTTIADPPESVRQRITQPDAVLQLAAQRAEHMAQQVASTGQVTAEEDQARIEFAQIDWQDFVIVESINFDDGAEISQAPLRVEDVEVKRLGQPKESQLVSPYTGELIPASEFNEHMRIMNLAPEQARKAAPTPHSSNLDMKNVAQNLKRFSKGASGERKRKK